MYGGGMQPRQRIRVTSAGGVVYRWDKDNPLFLLLASNKRGVWCLPKGLIEEGEDEVTTAMREVREETGVSRVKLHGKLGAIKYQFGFRAKTYDKTVHFFLFETDQADAKVGTEHDAMEWMPYEKALHTLSYPNEKEMLSKAWNAIKTEKGSSSEAKPDPGKLLSE
ncbi:NUDIX domain-containing protein [Candidatus Bathyarchaeota archaeon]|nr:MAG: NUDIX domain-containing protein [Candidatus Bathyarchaeota archaeon]